MKAEDVQIGKIYAVKVSGRIAPVKITQKSEYGGWYGYNMHTTRSVRIKSARRLRYEMRIK